MPIAKANIVVATFFGTKSLLGPPARTGRHAGRLREVVVGVARQGEGNSKLPIGKGVSKVQGRGMNVGTV